MKKIITVVAVISLVAVVAFPAMAYRGMGGGVDRNPSGYGMMDPSRGFDLTSEQTAKVNSLREAYLKDIKPIQDQLYTKRGDMRLLWLAKTPDQDKILALQKEIRNLRDQLTDKRTLYRLDARKVLTPEQLEKSQFCQGRGIGQKMAGGSGMSRMGIGSGMRGGQAPGWVMR